VGAGAGAGVVGTGSQVKVGKLVASDGQAAVAMLGVNPASQTTVQLSPSAIEVTPSPQAPVEAALTTPVGTAHAVLAVWQAKGSKVPAEQVTWELLAVNVSAQVTVHSAPWAVLPPPPQAPDACALATVEVVGSAHAFGVQVKAGKTPAVADPQTGEALAVYPLSQAAPQVAEAASEVTPAPQAPVATALATSVGTAHAVVESSQVKVGRVVESLGHAGMGMLGV
jgi:hypothetical protein